MPVVDDYTALLSGNYWNGIEVTGKPVIVTFSFPTFAPAYDATVPGFTADTTATFQPFTPAEQAQAALALGEWAAASGLVFVEVAPGQGDINFQNVDFSTTSYSGYGGVGFYPFGNWNYYSYPSFSGDLTGSGDVFMNSEILSNGTVAYDTLLHEIGHAIGLKHPTEVVTDTAADPNVVHDQVLASDDPTQTIMSEQADTTSGTGQHLKTLDKQAAAFLYGDAGTGGVYTGSASGANSVSSWSWDASAQTMTQTAAMTNDTIRGTSVNDIINGSDGNDQLFGLAGDDQLYGGAGNDSLYGGIGNDTLVGGVGDDSYFVDSATDIIVENPGEGTDTVVATVSFTLPDNVEVLQLSGPSLTGAGNNGGDLLYGDGTYGTRLIGGTGNDYIAGGAGNDTISGGGGIDVMWGAGGNDLFIFTSLSDAMVGGALTTIGDFTPGSDRIDLSAITTTGSTPGQPLHFIGSAAFSDQAGEVREDTSGTYPVIAGDVNGDGNPDFAIQLYGSPTLSASDFVFETPLCFLAGTQIATPGGERAVEHLSPGDMIRTQRGAARRIVWVGEGRVLATRARRNAATPVIVRKRALADNVPHHDLRLTKAHALWFDGVLVPVEFLVNHRSIIWDDHAREVRLYHIELETHDVLLANGAPAESYRDDGNRWLFCNANTGWGLPPQTPCAPVLTGGPLVDAIWQSLLDRTVPGRQQALTDDPDLHLRVDGCRIDPVARGGAAVSFALPARRNWVRIVSNAAAPAELGSARDPRRLGVAIRQIMLRRGRHLGVIPAADMRLTDGFHGFEPHEAIRWTDGDAGLPPEVFFGFDGPVELTLQLGGAARYPLFGAVVACAA